VPLNPVVRKGIRRRVEGQRCMESRVEAGYRGEGRVHGSNGSDPSQRAVLMQRREGPERTNPSLDICIDPGGARVPRSAVNHAVADSIGLRQPGERHPHRALVNAAIGQLQVTAREDRQPVIEHSQPQRTRSGINDKDTQASNDTRAVFPKPAWGLEPQTSSLQVPPCRVIAVFTGG
jgi:hypothetical protein